MRGCGDAGMRYETASGGRSFPRPFLILSSPHLLIPALQCPVLSTVAPPKFSVVTFFPFSSERT